MYGRDAYYSKVSNTKIIGDVIYADIETISINDNLMHQRHTNTESYFDITKRSYHQIDISRSEFHLCRKTTESEWNRISKYLKDVKDFYNYYKREE